MVNEETESGLNLVMNLMKSIRDYVQGHRTKFDSKGWQAIDTLVVLFSKLAHKTQSEELYWLLITISKDAKRIRFEEFANTLKDTMIASYKIQDFESTMITAEKLLKVPSSNVKLQTVAINYFAECKKKLGCEKLLESQDWHIKLKELQTYRTSDSLTPSRIKLVQELLQDKTIEVANKVFLLIEMSWIKFSKEEFEAGLDFCRQAHEECLPENSILKAMLHMWTGKVILLLKRSY